MILCAVCISEQVILSPGTPATYIAIFSRVVYRLAVLLTVVLYHRNVAKQDLMMLMCRTLKHGHCLRELEPLMEVSWFRILWRIFGFLILLVKRDAIIITASIHRTPQHDKEDSSHAHIQRRWIIIQHVQFFFTIGTSSDETVSALKWNLFGLIVTFGLLVGILNVFSCLYIYIYI